MYERGLEGVVARVEVLERTLRSRMVLMEDIMWTRCLCKETCTRTARLAQLYLY